MMNRKNIAIILVIVIFAFLLLFSLRSAQQTGDSLYYAYGVKTGYRMYHPHHLLYVPILRIAFIVLSLVGEFCDAILVAQIHNIIWAIVAVLSLYKLISYLTSSTLFGVLSAAFLLVTQGFWHYTTQVEVYVPALGALALLLSILIVRYRSSLTFAGLSVISLLLATAIFYHQTNILFCIPLACYMISSQTHPVRVLAMALSLAGIVVSIAYIGAFSSIHETLSFNGFLRFCLSYGYKSNPNWGTFDNFSVAGMNSLVNSQVWNLIALPLNWRPVTKLLIIFGTTVILSWNLIQIFRRKEFYKIRSFLFLWFATYVIFFLWWLPEEREFFIITSFPLIPLIFMTVNDAKKMKKMIGCPIGRHTITIVLTFVVVLVLVLNLPSILRFHRSRGSKYYSAHDIGQITPQDCIIGADYAVQQHLRYYFDREHVFQLKKPLLLLYRHQNMPKWLELKSEKCIIVPLSYVIPEYSVSGFNGYNHPSEWVEFLKWLFRLEYNTKGMLVASRSFQIIIGNPGDEYLLLLDSPMRIEGLYQLFQELDGQISKQVGQRKKPFQDWFFATVSGDQ